MCNGNGMTRTQEKVIAFLKANPCSAARSVAMHLWPDSKGWARMSGGWNGCQGKLMPAKAGVILRRMEEAGLVRCHYGRHPRDAPRWSIREET